MNQETTQDIIDRLFGAGLTLEFSQGDVLTVSPAGRISDELQIS